MKKTFTLIVIMAASVHFAQAQQTRFGFQAGMSMAKIHSEGGGESSNTDLKLGFTAGLMMDYTLGKHLAFQPELTWMQKGGQESSDVTSKISLNYLEIPLKLLYRSHGDHGFFIGGGPAIAYGMGGKFKAGDFSSKLHFGSGPNDLGKPIDFSLLATAGYLSQRGFQVSFTYDQSLSNYSNESGYSIRNNYMALRVGYLFKSGKH